MGFEITLLKHKTGYHFDYLGFLWRIGTFSYFCYKVYNKERFYAYDAVWLFTTISVDIPNH
jgi:hypothetical protein